MICRTLPIATDASFPGRIAHLFGCASLVLAFFISIALPAALRADSEATAGWIKIVNAPQDTVTVTPNIKYQYIFQAGGSLVKNPKWFTATPTDSTLRGKYSIAGSGHFEFTPAAADSGKECAFVIVAGDATGLVDTAYINFKVRDFVPLVFEIASRGRVLPRVQENTSILYTGDSISVSDIRLTIELSTRELELEAILPGRALESSANLNYEILSEATGTASDSVDHIVVSIEFRSSDDSEWTLYPGEIAILMARLANEWPYDCGYCSVNFHSEECSENVIESGDGIKTTAVSNIRTRSLRESSKRYGLLNNRFHLAYRMPVEDLDFADCSEMSASRVLRLIVLKGGGYEPYCDYMPNGRGDMNLNGIESEIEDYELYADFLWQGDLALDPNPQFREAQYAASDINGDGAVVSLSDAVYLEQIVMGTAPPFAKLKPFSNSATFGVHNDTLYVDTPVPLEALRVTFYGYYDEPGVENLTPLTMHKNVSDSASTYLLIHHLNQPYSQDGNLCPAGRHPLLILPDIYVLMTFEAVDSGTNPVSIEVER